MEFEKKVPLPCQNIACLEWKRYDFLICGISSYRVQKLQTVIGSRAIATISRSLDTRVVIMQRPLAPYSVAAAERALTVWVPEEVVQSLVQLFSQPHVRWLGLLFGLASVVNTTYQIFCFCSDCSRVMQWFRRQFQPAPQPQPQHEPRPQPELAPQPQRPQPLHLSNSVPEVPAFEGVRHRRGGSTRYTVDHGYLITPTTSEHQLHLFKDCSHLQDKSFTSRRLCGGCLYTLQKLE